ncbi:hypothetical protein COCSADRAFT_35715 [Bipolaris sorokiniana ND90Pr]|uniref:Uncharacterized protein n=1 Tax=Cochliobolus sativus (strain ND90Pr / ATCC 201652) TaxID=665912 RepID=M2RFZ4_COCSN|nr:uncharacterized protein COCSADRAFT_35715 [Bipolaris sorokiniana ND90Pr]EMD65679.1 hypothetical protein COCSADRAFT_35715 [Bipolaris sorokiniana ND90Pr]
MSSISRTVDPYSPTIPATFPTPPPIFHALLLPPPIAQTYTGISPNTHRQTLPTVTDRPAYSNQPPSNTDKHHRPPTTTDHRPPTKHQLLLTTDRLAYTKQLPTGHPPDHQPRITNPIRPPLPHAATPESTTQKKRGGPVQPNREKLSAEPHTRHLRTPIPRIFVESREMRRTRSKETSQVSGNMHVRF